jgi:hypothetical protein
LASSSQVPEAQVGVLQQQGVGLSAQWFGVSEVASLVSQDHPIEVYGEKVQMVGVLRELFVLEALWAVR